VVYRLLADEVSREELLTFRRQLPPEPEARPAAPALVEALERHAFLRYDQARDELTAIAGDWHVQGDLVLPAGIGLALVPGTRLAFDAGAVLLADAPLRFTGSSQEPIVLEPADGAADWAGVVVLAAQERSEWKEVVVRRTRGVARPGWKLDAGVSFYRSPVTLTRCRFESAQAEDALNVFGTDVLLEQVTFTGSAHDSFAGDFVSGALAGCLFQDGGGDGVELRGGRVAARAARFQRLAHKAFSIGDGSRARIEGGAAEDVSVGVAARDGANVEVTGLAIRARHFGLAAYVTKPEAGAAHLRARGVEMQGAGLAPAVADAGCELELDGAAVPAKEIDVEAACQEEADGSPR
jgi:hypothetical protein